MTHRIAFSAFESVADAWCLTGHERATLLDIDLKTYDKWYRANESVRISSDQARRVVRLISIYDSTHKVFGDAEYANDWVHRTNAALDGRSPLEVMLESLDGIRAVDGHLERVIADYARDNPSRDAWLRRLPNSPRINHAVALKAFNRVADAWHLSTNERCQILGAEPGIYEAWTAGTEKPKLSEPQIITISKIINIYDGLHRLFGDESFADLWVREASAALQNEQPLDLMSRDAAGLDRVFALVMDVLAM
jgi:putative toxin-antitoxin system antitoxin component (TIGR02293 family)